MNVLIDLVESKPGWEVAVLETAWYPARYYAGYVWFDLKAGEWRPDSNETQLWHHEVESARDAAKKIAAKAKE